MRIPEPVNIMTASLVPGDAIGNYILTLRRLLEHEGKEVQLFADHIAPQYGDIARLSRYYRPGTGTLWYHYSIYADNLKQIQKPAGFKIVDYHGVSPPALLQKYDPHLADLCKQGVDELPSYNTAFDISIVHSEYTRGELQRLGFRDVHKLPLVVDTSRFSGSEDTKLSELLQRLSYLLFVGRMVPQKDLLAMIEIFAHFHRLQPEAVLTLVGGRHLASAYQREIGRLIKHHHLEGHVLFTGQVNDASMLTSLYQHAKFTLITSEWESFCVPIVESMTFGTPLIIHSTPPLPEVMGRAGIVIDKRDPAAAAAAIHRLWNDREAYTKLVDVCVGRANAFTEAALASQLLSLFGGIFRDD